MKKPLPRPSSPKQWKKNKLHNNIMKLLVEKLTNDLIFCIYCIENLLSGRKYYGSTIRPLRRFKEHKNKLKGNKHDNIFLQNDWNKTENPQEIFVFYILEYIEDETKLLEKEQEYLDKYHGKDDCYNLNPNANKPKINIASIIGHYDFNLISPNGKIYTHIDNFSNFCRTHNLTRQLLERVIKGKRKSHRGWRVVGTTLNDRIKTYEIKIISPYNIIYEAITNLNQFCQINNVDVRGIHNIITGKRKSHKGWKLANQENI